MADFSRVGQIQSWSFWETCLGFGHMDPFQVLEIRSFSILSCLTSEKRFKKVKVTKNVNEFEVLLYEYTEYKSYFGLKQLSLICCIILIGVEILLDVKQMVPYKWTSFFNFLHFRI